MGLFEVDEICDSLLESFLVPKDAYEFHVIRSPVITLAQVIAFTPGASDSGTCKDGTADGIGCRCGPAAPA